MHKDQRELAQTVAHILGESSAAANALRELTRLESNGEQCRLYAVRGQWLLVETKEPNDGE